MSQNIKYNHKNKRAVKATNLKTNEVHYFPSFYRIDKELGVDKGTVRRICEGIKYYKTAWSKFDDHYNTFEYVD